MLVSQVYCKPMSYFYNRIRIQISRIPMYKVLKTFQEFVISRLPMTRNFYATQEDESDFNLLWIYFKLSLHVS